MPSLFDYAASISDILQYLALHMFWLAERGTYEDPYYHALSARGFAVQTYLRIPHQVGLFSPEPCRMRGIEGFFMVSFVCSVAVLYLTLGVAAIYIRGSEEEFGRVARKAAWFFPMVLIVTGKLQMSPLGPVALWTVHGATCRETAVANIWNF